MIKYSGSTVLTKIFQLIKSKFDSLATVATTGSYNDLLDTPDTNFIIKASTEVTEETTTINIPFSITNTDNLSVYQNGILLTPNTHYTATLTSITLNNYTAKSGDIFTFLSTSLSAGVSINPSAANITILDADSHFTGVTSVEGALKYLAENSTASIKSISLNNETINPDSEGNVNITLNIPIKSLSLNNETISPDSDGLIALTNIMKTNTTQTMSAILTAYSNTNYTTRQVRNIIFVPEGTDLPTGSNGDICMVYTE